MPTASEAVSGCPEADEVPILSAKGGVFERCLQSKRRAGASPPLAARSFFSEHCQFQGLNTCDSSALASLKLLVVQFQSTVRPRHGRTTGLRCWISASSRVIRTIRFGADLRIFPAWSTIAAESPLMSHVSSRAPFPAFCLTTLSVSP